jgi:hypothetical protein
LLSPSSGICQLHYAIDEALGLLQRRFPLGSRKLSGGTSITRLIVYHKIVVIVHRNKYAMAIPQFRVP